VRLQLRTGLRAPRLACLALPILLAAAPPAVARERLAVLIVVDGDPGLSDNLTELAIATLAERRDRELVGLRELRESLAVIVPPDGLGSCMAQPACVARILVAAGVTEAVIGQVRPATDRYNVHLALTRSGALAPVADRTKEVPREGAALIAAVREGTVELLAQMDADARAVAPPPALALPISPVAASAGHPTPTLVELDPHADNETVRRRNHRWQLYLGFGAGALAVVSLSAAVVTGSMGTVAPMGASRAEAQADLVRRDDYTETANGLFILSGVLSAAAVAALVLWWRSDREHRP
jgi:hypothetical protein